MHFMMIRVEGFQLEKLLSLCLKHNIPLRNLRMRSDMEMTFTIDRSYYEQLLRLAKNRHQITVIDERGIVPPLTRILKKKSTLIGVALFVLLLVYQSSYVSEIRVNGYERLTESEIREELAAAGLYEGCNKNVDLDRVEIRMFQALPDISWIGITLKGNMAVATVIEGTPELEQVDTSKACHIVATREGYIETIIAREGKEAVAKGDFVEEGDMLITGILTIEDKTYTSDPENPPLRYVHANGEVYAKTVYRFIRYQEKNDILKKLTGKSLWGFSIKIGDLILDTSKILWPYDQAIYEEKEIVDWIRPIPFRLMINRQMEVQTEKVERTEASIESLGNRQARDAIKENISELARISNKSLKFSAEENIIKVIIMVEAVEQIGAEKAFLPGDTNDNKEGIDALGEPAN